MKHWLADYIGIFKLVLSKFSYIYTLLCTITLLTLVVDLSESKIRGTAMPTYIYPVENLSYGRQDITMPSLSTASG
jgi:hypothetical protein